MFGIDSAVLGGQVLLIQMKQRMSKPVLETLTRIKLSIEIISHIEFVNNSIILKVFVFAFSLSQSL